MYNLLKTLYTIFILFYHVGRNNHNSTIPYEYKIQMQLLYYYNTTNSKVNLYKRINYKIFYNII